MNRTGFLVLAAPALILAVSLSVGLLSFVGTSMKPGGSESLLPHLWLAAAIAIGLSGLLIFFAGFVGLRYRQLPGWETLAWVLLMLVFPVVGSAVSLLVSPQRQQLHPARA